MAQWQACRYADLLRGGAEDFKLDRQFCAWLNEMPTVPSEKKRGDEYWHDLDGRPMKMLPKIWKGSEQQGCVIGVDQARASKVFKIERSFTRLSHRSSAAMRGEPVAVKVAKL